MTGFAALLANCLCCATFATVSNPDQWTGTMTPVRVTDAQIAAIPKDPRSNVVQFPKHLLMDSLRTGAPVAAWDPWLATPNQVPLSPPAQP
jgi:hypothetical protein